MDAVPLVCLFAKPPQPGSVKTRLAAEFGETGAARLARAFLRDSLAQLRALPWARVVLATTGPLSEPVAREVGQVEVWAQGPGDLGARLERVLARALRTAPAALAVGADSPGLPAARLEAAREAIAAHDAVLGPADDGGFYLLGLRRCPPGLLSGLRWSRRDTFARTRARLAEWGLGAALIERWFDVDRPEDLRRLRSLLKSGRVHAPQTARVLDSMHGAGSG